MSGIDRGHDAVGVFERAVDDLDVFVDFVRNFDARLGLRIDVFEGEESLDVRFERGHRFAARTGEIADAVRFAHEEPRVVIQDHLDHDITGVEFAFNFVLFSVLGEFFHAFDRDIDFFDVFIETCGLNSTFKFFFHAVFAVDLTLEDIPLRGLRFAIIDVFAIVSRSHRFTPFKN